LQQFLNVHFLDYPEYPGVITSSNWWV